MGGACTTQEFLQQPGKSKDISTDTVAPPFQLCIALWESCVHHTALVPSPVAVLNCYGDLDGSSSHRTTGDELALAYRLERFWFHLSPPEHSKWRPLQQQSDFLSADVFGGSLRPVEGLHQDPVGGRHRP